MVIITRIIIGLIIGGIYYIIDRTLFRYLGSDSFVGWPEALVLGMVFVFVSAYISKIMNRNKVEISDINKERRQKKEEIKTKIIDLLKQKGQVKNDEIERLFNVSDSTATNYLEELEKEGKITQIGKEGRSVIYKTNG